MNPNINELIKEIIDLLDEVSPATPEEVDEFLLAHGYNPDEIAEGMKNVAARALAELLSNWQIKFYQ